MKIAFWGALVGAVMLALASPAGATTVTGTSTINALGSIAAADPDLNFGAGATGVNVASFGGGKTYYDYVFSFTLTDASDVTVTTTATPDGPYAFNAYAALFDSSPISGQVPAGSSLTDANAAPLSLTNTAGLLALGSTNGGALSTLSLAAGTYYLRLFGLLPGNINSGHMLTGISGTIAATAVAATPIPAALPLFASALGLFGFVGWRRKTAAPAAAA
ncbi:hypothetical protein [Dongia sp. agr-C8]